MGALEKEKASSIRKITRDKRPLSDGVKAIKGGVAACDSAGYYCPATGASTEVVVGRFVETVDNTEGSNGDLSADVHFFRERVVFLEANDTGTALDATDRERPCYQKDDQTVTGDSSKSVAGIVYDVTSEGVWVEFVAPRPGATGTTGATGPTGTTGATGATGPA